MLATLLTPGLVGLALAAASAAPCGEPPAGMVCVPGGLFPRGRDDGPRDERPRAEVFVDTFYLDITEVTASAFASCQAAGTCRKRAGPNYKRFDAAEQPMVGVNWFDARDYCQSLGKRLPTEAEWERAARGHNGGLYPWGDAPATCKTAVIQETTVRDTNGCGRGTTWEVKSRAPNDLGLYDMAGNSWEWVADWYSPTYAVCGAACTGENPRGPCAGADRCPGHEMRVVRGGSWFWGASFATTSKRRPHTPQNKPFHHFGFRCARDLR